MNIVTGQTVPDLRLLPSYDPTQWVQVEGTPEQIDTLSRRVSLGAQEADRRAKRRQQQKRSRKVNRKRG